MNLDDHRILGRHDFHHWFARLNDATDGVNNHILDDAVDRAGDFCAQPLLAGLAQAFADFSDLALIFAGLRLGFTAELEVKLTQPLLRFLQRQTGFGDGDVDGVQLALNLLDRLFLVIVIDLGDQLIDQKGVGDGQVLFGDIELGANGFCLGLKLLDCQLGLLDLLLENGLAALQFAAARFEGIDFGRREFRLAFSFLFR